MPVRRPSTFASLLKRHRDAAGLTQEELARRAGLGARTVSNLERGVNKTPYSSTIRRLADALDLSGEDRTGLAASARHPAEDSSRGDRIEGGFLGALPTARLVAREEELERIVDALEAVAGGSGRLALLAGEPGIGKTRLAQEACVHAWGRGFLVATGRCYEAQGGVPFYPFLEALDTLYEEASQEVREAIPERWPYLTRLLPDHFPISQTAATSESREESQRLLRAVTGFVREISAGRPVLLMLDDLHWADGASVDLLAHLTRHTRPDRVLLLGTYRDVEVGSRHPLRKAVRELSREQLVQKIGVRRLGPEETAALMSDRLDGAEVSEEFAGLVYDHTGGNPFFTVEVLKALVERGDLLRWEGSWIRKEIEDLTAPESVSEAISERVSRLQLQTQKALEEASVLGQVFGFEDLMTLAGLGEEEAEEALEEAEASGLVRAAKDRYAFDHALTQQTLYAGLSPARRKRLHRSAGEGLEKLGEKVRRKRAAEIARHFVEGSSPARALPYALVAGDAAGAVFAHAEAERHYRSALGLAEEVGDLPKEAEALRKIGEALTSAGRYDEALAALERAANLFAQAGDHEGEMWAAARIGWVHFWMGRAEEEVIARLWTLAGHDSGVSEPSGVSPLTLYLLRGALATLLFVAHDYHRMLEVARQSSILARKLGDKWMVARADITCGTALVFLRRPAEALKVLEVAVPLAEEINSTGKIPLAEQTNSARNLADGILFLDLLYAARGELDLSLRWAERGLALAEQLDIGAVVAFRLGRVGLNLFYRGEWEKARAHLERGTEMARSLGPSFYSVWLPQHLSMLCMAEGAWEEAARLLEEATGMAERVKWPAPLHNAQYLRAELDLSKGHPRAALARLEPLADALDLDWTCATELLTVLAQAYLELDDAKEAEEIAERALRVAEQMHNRLGATGALRVKGMAQSQQGRREEAARTLEEALGMARSMPYPYAEGRILREYAMLEGEPERARLCAALDIFRRLGASKDIEQIEQAFTRTQRR